MIIVKCAWCGDEIKYKICDEEGTSHGICDDCYAKQQEELIKLKKSINGRIN